MMFSQPDDPNCPVKSFKLYIAKLHLNLDLFLQQPNPNFQSQPNWSIKSPLGAHTIGSMMENMSASANTFKVYINQCIHMTATAVLKRARCQVTDIIAVTGHQNMASLIAL